MASLSGKEVEFLGKIIDAIESEGIKLRRATGQIMEYVDVIQLLANHAAMKLPFPEGEELDPKVQAKRSRKPEEQTASSDS
jgi:hypothetical protein